MQQDALAQEWLGTKVAMGEIQKDPLMKSEDSQKMIEGYEQALKQTSDQLDVVGEQIKKIRKARKDAKALAKPNSINGKAALPSP